MPAMAARPNIRKLIRQYPIADGEDFLEGAAVVLSGGEVEECAADPQSILGFALHDAGADPDTDKVLVAIAAPDATFILQGTSAPAASDVGVQYGLVEDSDGVWTVDKTETTTVSVVVVKVYEDREEFEVRVLADVCQVAA